MKKRNNLIHGHKNLSPAELSDETIEAIRKEAAFWRINSVPIALEDYLLSQNVDVKKVIFYNIDVDFPGIPNICGNLATEDGQFFSFEINANADKTKILSIEAWENVTDQQNLSKSNKGYKFGLGYLVLKVLKEMNQQ